jgi:Ca-activated chloride channel family protein
VKKMSAFELLTEGRKPVELAMQSLWMTGSVLPAGAVLRVRHEFGVGGNHPVEAVYCFGLPRDAALRRFQLRTGSMVAHSELRPTEEAVKEYERGIEAGSLSALARQYGDGLVNLSVGNIRPGDSVVVDLEIVAGVELQDRGLRLRFPFTLAPSYHNKAVAISPEPGWCAMELPAGEFGDVMLPRWAQDARGLHRVGFDLELEMGTEVEKVGSPSHRITAERKRVALAGGGDLPDRDLVLDVESNAGARVLVGGRQVSAVIPSTEFGNGTAGGRDVVLLIDRSGSMSGAPFAQAKSAALACVASLEPSDRFGLALFSTGTMVWKQEMVEATKENRKEAAEFLAAYDAAGGTELGPAIEDVAKLIGSTGGEVLLLTDGQVFGGETVLATARRVGIRLHTLGIGSASQDRMLSLLARETGGVSRFVTPRERVDEAALELFAGAGRAVARGVEALVEGAVTVAPAEKVYRGMPVAFMGRLSDGAAPAVGVRWEGGERRYPVKDEGATVGEALRLLEGARRITDLDCRLGAGEKERQRLRNALRRLSEEYGLASREMSLVAVMERQGDVAGEVPHTMVVPVGLPEDMEMRGVFSGRQMHCLMKIDAPPPHKPHDKLSRVLANLLDTGISAWKKPPAAEPADPVMELATMLEDDGGMPGRSLPERIENSLKALEIFVSAGGGFAAHAGRVARFLKAQRLDEAVSTRLKEIEEGKRVAKDPKKEAAALCRRLMK